ncbi:hypothetical protein [Hyphomonas atlantica]|uniref:hypothetical protein n=1 Tax=Hyphomonas atlantica TaxID=1280948 RepID=UPI000559598E|nr:hypothetical protein [Hyphomonas atlantica]
MFQRDDLPALFGINPPLQSRDNTRVRAFDNAVHKRLNFRLSRVRLFLIGKDALMRLPVLTVPKIFEHRLSEPQKPLSGLQLF